jgi:hypothetical protein
LISGAAGDAPGTPFLLFSTDDDFGLSGRNGKRI